MTDRSNFWRQLDGGITLRCATAVDDYRACQDAQRQAWGIGDDSYLVPVATLVGANLHGGLVLGAFTPGGSAVAMSFAFLGRVGGRLCLYSQLTGVIPAYQSRGLGYQIKYLQRDIARAEGIDRIAWAFDPLQAGNAHFNIARLGATAAHFVENMYGFRTDALNAGVATDRLIAEWSTSAEILGSPALGLTASLPRLIETTISQTDPGGSMLEAPVALRPPALETACCLLQVPHDIAQLRREDPEMAERWRLLVARGFRLAFENSHRATRFIRDDSAGLRRSFYVLERV